MNTDKNPMDDTKLPKQEASCCGSSCNCHDKGSAGKTRWIIGIIVLAAAGALVARAMVKTNAPVNASAPTSREGGGCGSSSGSCGPTGCK